MTVATLCASAWVRLGLGTPAPGVWLGNAETTAQELVEFSREALRMVAEAHDWQALAATYTATLTGATEQTVVLPADFKRLVPDTVWTSSVAWPIRGPLTDAEYEDLRQPPSSAAGPVFRLTGNTVQILGNPGASGTLTFRYISSQPVVNGGSRRETWLLDADAALVDERLVLLALMALWRDARGLNSDGALAQYQLALSRARANDRPLGVMTLGASRNRIGAPVGRGDGTTVSAI